ncbi:MAG: polyketide synthase dehydratase domain-containing protein [Gemmataceae bacterium]
MSANSRASVMEQYLGVMEQFLDTQRGSPRRTWLPGVGQAASLSLVRRTSWQLVLRRKAPLLGDTVRLVPGQEVVTRRLLDVAEDRFVLDHTVGGRMVSKADPEQHGVPVMPMTFTLEVLAEAAGVLVPDQYVIAIKQIRLLRWLAFEPDEPALIEVSAKLEGTNDAGQVLVKAEIRDFGPAREPNQKGPRVASGTVVFAREYPAPPAPVGLPGDEPRPITMTVEQVYHNLFHGPMFQGVTRTIRGNDVSIEAGVEVLPRERLFRSAPQPDFHFDPVLLDVVLHPLATWHLHQPDLAGRIMLPVGIDAAEFFAPPAAPGTGLVSRSWISEANLRSFTHGGEVIAADGSVYLRLAGVKCWRFYVPFGEVNFHGPKDQYFLGRRWTEVEEKTETPFALVRLEVPPDLKQPAMSRVTAQVTLTAAEIAEFRCRTREGGDVHGWLFDRIAAKDAIRLLWHDRTGERLYPADIECQQDEAKYTAHRRGLPGDTFDRAVVAGAGGVVAALSTSGPACGLAVGTADEPLDQLKQRCLAGIDGGEQYRVRVVTDGECVVAYTIGERADA